jgi:protein KRI1
VPTYNEVTTSTQERRKKKGKAKVEPQPDDDENPDKNEEDDAGLLSDTSFESLASHFEASYNHRFEEPGAASIPSFPRNLPSLVRRQDTTRKDARERRKQRKEEELQKKKEEVRRLKALKMREVKRKLELIGRQGGLKKGFGAAEGGEDDDEFVDEALRELDLDGEWDPEKHDRQMAGLFDRGAEAFEDEGASVDGLDDDEGVDGVRYDADGKPVWDDDIDIGDIPISDDDDTNVVFPGIEQPSKKEKKKKKKKKKGGEDDDGGVDIDAMDADVAPRFDEDEEWDGTEEMRKRKFNEYMDEIYGLDFNDMVIGLILFPKSLLSYVLRQIGDLPTRFKYVPVQPQTYALTPAEILMATDQELNEYMSVKKYAPYRHDKSNPQRWNKKTQEKLHELKAKVGERTGTSFINNSRGRGEDGQEKVKKRKGKKERMKLKAVNEDAEGAADIEMEEGPPNGVEPKAPEQNGKGSKKRKRDSGEGLEDEEGRHASRQDNASVGDSESAAKKKRKRRHRKKEEGEAPAQQA